MLNDVLLYQVLETMENDNDFMFLRGQLRNIQQREKDNKEVYYLADLKVAKSVSNDEKYGMAYDIYHVCFSNEFVKMSNVDIEKMKDFKDNEVFVYLTPVCKINTNKKDGIVSKFNSANFYVNDIMLLNQVSKKEFLKSKVVNV